MSAWRWLKLDILPASADLGLLVLRLWLGLSMAILHGWVKFTHFGEIAGRFPALILSPRISLGLATFAELICATLVAIGLFTRFAALTVAITMAVAFTAAHKGALSGESSGELAFIFLAGFLAILIAGPGRYSLDAKIKT